MPSCTDLMQESKPAPARSLNVVLKQFIPDPFFPFKHPFCAVNALLFSDTFFFQIILNIYSFVESRLSVLGLSECQKDCNDDVYKTSVSKHLPQTCSI